MNEQRKIMPCGITVDSEGNWFYEGNPIIRKDILEIFYDNLHFDPDVGFWIEWHGSFCLIEAEDTPFVITRVDREKTSDSEEKIVLHIKHLRDPEILNPSTLWIGKSNILYCLIKDEKIPARFARPAYYQFAQWVEEENGRFFLSLNGKKYFIEEKVK
ncbi:MAG: DUF1285 domain-containing protein [Deltaproteobacteria bacterium]|nr:DUF1285 domain-containing protein [Deltaproteobacteria bacterium]MBW2067677.1 DUF1285 domain-containing protein [Deltaproteobacteria bacterium]